MWFPVWQCSVTEQGPWFFLKKVKKDLTRCQNLVYYKLMIERNPNERKRLYEY